MKLLSKNILPIFLVSLCLLTACSKGGSIPNSTNSNNSNNNTNTTNSYVVSTFAGGNRTGAVDGTGTSAGFAYPTGIVMDASGTLYVADPSSNSVRKITSAGVVTTLAHSPFFADSPQNIALDSKGNVFIVGMGVVYKITSAGAISAYATSDLSSYPNAILLPFSNPYGLVADAFDNIYITSYDTPVVLKITTTGTTTKFGSGGYATIDGTGTSASFNYPQGLTADALGNVYVVDFSPTSANGLVIRKISSAGVVTTINPTPAIPAISSTYEEMCLAMDASGNFYASVNRSGKIYEITPSGTSTLIAGISDGAGPVNGPALSATFYLPHGIAVNSTGSIIYIADSGNEVIRKIVKQ